MGKTKADTEFLHVVFQVCSKADLEGLLRIYKPLDRDNIRIGADGKKELVYGNLRSAIDRGTVPLVRVQSLVRDREEHSGHHHFYYYPKDAKTAKRLNDPEEAARRLLGRDWQSLVRFEQLPTDYGWAGFRIETASSGQQLGWAATLYGREIAERRDVQIKTTGKIIRIEPEPVKVVLIARWRRVGVLELCVPGIDPQILIDDMLVKLWTWIEPAVSSTDVSAWDLDPVRARLVRDALGNKAKKRLYTLGPSRVRDGEGGPTTIRGVSPSDDLVSAKERAEALRVFMAGGDNCDSLVVYWLQQDGLEFIPPGGLRTVIGPIRATAATNEVIFSSKANGLATDYVLNRLREVAKP